MKRKYILYSMAIALVGVVLSHTYRPYIYANHIDDFHLADVIGNIVCVPAVTLFFYGIDNRHSLRWYVLLSVLVYIAYEFLGLWGIHGTFDFYDILATLFSGAVCYALFSPAKRHE